MSLFGKVVFMRVIATAFLIGIISIAGGTIFQIDLGIKIALIAIGIIFFIVGAFEIKILVKPKK